MEAQGSAVSAAMAAQMREGLARVSGPDVEEDVAAAREVGEALRRVIDRLTGTSAPPEVLLEAVERLAPIEDLLRPFGTYTLVTCTPPQRAPMSRVSVSGSRWAAKPGMGSSMPTRDRMATPFHWPEPWCTVS